MVDEALTFDDLNVIVVDWVGGIHKNNKLSALVIKKIYISIGSGPPYTQAVANIRLIGVMLAHFILFLHVSCVILYLVLNLT